MILTAVVFGANMLVTGFIAASLIRGEGTIAGGIFLGLNIAFAIMNGCNLFSAL